MIQHNDQHINRKLNYQIEIRCISSKDATEHETVMRRASLINKDESHHKNADTQLS